MTEHTMGIQKKNIRGICVSYRVSGDGLPVILLHGWGASSESFRTVHDCLMKQYRVYSIDLPGFGGSDEPSDSWRLDDYVDVIQDFISELAIVDAVLIGHSFGGRIIIKLAARHSVIIDKIVLIDSAGIKPRRSLRYWIRLYTYKSARRLSQLPLIRAFSYNAVESMRRRIESVDYRNASEAMRKIMVRIIDEDLTPLLPAISVPVLLIWGEKDTATPLSDGQLMDSLIPDSGLVIFKGAGHWSFIERIRDFMMILSSFLDNDVTIK